MTPWFLAERLAEHAREAGDEVALVYATGTTTWRELDARADAVARVVRGRLVRGPDVAPASRVAITATPTGDTLAAMVGILRAGGVAALVPPGLTVREVAAAREVLAPALVLDDREIEGLDPAVAAPGPRGQAASHRGAASPTDPEAAAVVVLTSGTTGRPRGVVLSHRALAASADAWLAALPPATGWVLPLSLGHVAGLGVAWRAAARRVPIRFVPPADPAALLDALRGTPPASHVPLVPAQLARLLEAAGDGPPPAGLRAVLLGGGAIPAALVERAARAGWPVMPTFGLSEAGSGVTVLPADDVLLAPGTAGRPLPGVRVTIEDAGPDGIGEIVVATPAAFSGHAGEPPRPPGEPIRTGDLGRLDEAGRLVVVDRRVDRIVRGGENVAPAEVEGALRAHPAVADAAVVGRPDELWGQVPVAAVVLREDAADPGDPSLAAHARGLVAGFKVPVAFVRLDALPRTAGGKLRREAVRALLAGEPSGTLARPDGDAIGWRLTGRGPQPVLLLHGTLSSARQLDRLAALLAGPGDLAVHAIDRRGSGSGRLARPRPLHVSVHLDDLVAYLDARGIERAAIVGVSFGGVLALELASRRPDRVSAVVAWEPPYGELADSGTRAWFHRLAADTVRAHAAGGPAAAAETFLRAVAGDAAWDRLGPRARGFLEQEGDGALADAGLSGLDPDGLARIEAPVSILTGAASEAFYAPIADALAAAIPGARRDVLSGLAHPAPITDPATVAAALRACLELPA